MAMGNKIIPEETILIDATWNAERLISPSLIRIKLLPHINDNAEKISQLIIFGFKFSDVFDRQRLL